MGKQRTQNVPIASCLATVVLIFLTLSATVSASEQDQLATQQDKLQELGQRLVRRNFLRFGKRSGSLNPTYSINGPSKGTLKRAGADQGLQPGQSGPGEQYELMLMAGKHPHKSNTRSFLRFGKRADNFLRFGKSLSELEEAERKRIARATRYNGDWEQRLLALLSRLDKDEVNEQYVKKSNDFLRFG